MGSERIILDHKPDSPSNIIIAYNNIYRSSNKTPQNKPTMHFEKFSL